MQVLGLPKCFLPFKTAVLSGGCFSRVPFWKGEFGGLGFHLESSLYLLHYSCRRKQKTEHERPWPSHWPPLELTENIMPTSRLFLHWLMFCTIEGIRSWRKVCTTGLYLHSFFKAFVMVSLGTNSINSYIVLALGGLVQVAYLECSCVFLEAVWTPWPQIHSLRVIVVYQERWCGLCFCDLACHNPIISSTS